MVCYKKMIVLAVNLLKTVALLFLIIHIYFPFKINNMTIICFSHLRWNFVYQRPQHLLSRFAKNYTVYFIEEPLFHEDGDCYTILNSEENVHVIKQYLSNKDDSDVYKRQHDLLKIFLQ